jgi:hypothetical protein
VRTLLLAIVVVLAGCGEHSAGSRRPPSDGGSGDGASGLAAPRPIAPISVAWVTSRRPVFRWNLPAAADGARVEVCSDRGCLSPAASFEASGDHGTPTEDLPAGVLFWRLRAMQGGATGDAVSPTWQLVVPHRSAPVATAWGSMLDADGDGYGDVVVGDSDSVAPTQHVYVHRGGIQGPSLAPSSVLSAPSPVARYAYALASAGDVDGDGFADLLVGSPGEDTVYVYRGGPAGLADPPSAVLVGTAKSAFGTSVSGAGDVDGDGYADLVVGAPSLSAVGSPVVGGAVLFYGGPSGPSAARGVTLAPRTGSDAQGLGTFVSGAGDVDGDGLGDVAVWGGIESTDPQYVLVYLGKDAPFGAAPSTLLQYDGANPSWLGSASLLACAGDANGDGYPDLVMSTAVDPGSGFATDHISIFTGGPAGPSVLPWRRVDTPLGITDHFGLSVAGIDVDQDGLGDIGVSVASYAQPPVAALFYRGAASGPSLAATITTSDPTTLYEREIASPGDVDGDGYPDLLVAFPARRTMAGDAGATGVDGGANELRGAVEVHVGGPGGAGVSARWTLRPPDGGAVAYGASLAHL